MGQNGSLTFYTTHPPQNPKAMLRALVVLARPQAFVAPTRSVGEDREWESFIKDGPDTERERLPRPRGAEEFVEYYREGTNLNVHCIASPLADRIEEAISSSIPVSVRGDFVPCDLYLRIGYHDQFEDAEHEEGLFIARPFLSVEFFSYSTPNDWQAFRDAVFQIPEVQAVKNELESIAGPLEQCIIWSV